MLTEDYERGGVAVNDPSQGLNLRDWKCWTDGSSVYVAPWPEMAPQTLVLNDAGITEVSLAFDQNMRPTVAYVAGGLCKLYWFDAALPGTTTSAFAGCESPMLTLDDKRASQTGSSDIIMVYLRVGAAQYRLQRDRFGIERTLGAVPDGVVRITNCGMGLNGRLQVYMSATAAIPGLHADLLGDNLYLAMADNSVRALIGTSAQQGLWRSGVFVTNDQPTLGWVKLEANAYPVTLTVYADGLPAAVLTIIDDEPQRLPPVRAREWQIEVASAARVTSVRLAECREELEADDANLSL